MAILDYITGPWNAIWAGLEGHAQWSALIKPNNRLKYAPGEATTVKRNASSSTDFPKAWLTPGNMVDDLVLGDETFATQDNTFDPFTSQWYETIMIDYLLIINSRLLKIGEIDLIGIYTLQAIRRLGPKLRLDYVTQVGKISIVQKEADRTESSVRWDFIIRIPVVVQAEGRDLMAS